MVDEQFPVCRAARDVFWKVFGKCGEIRDPSNPVLKSMSKIYTSYKHTMQQIVSEDDCLIAYDFRCGALLLQWCALNNLLVAQGGRACYRKRLVTN